MVELTAEVLEDNRKGTLNEPWLEREGGFLYLYMYLYLDRYLYLHSTSQ